MHSTNTPPTGHDDWEWAPLAPPPEFVSAHDRLSNGHELQAVLAEAMKAKNFGPIKLFDEADRMALMDKLDRAAQKALDLSHALSAIAAAVGQYGHSSATEGDVL